MKLFLQWQVLAFLLVTTAGCNSSTGQDSLTKRIPYSRAPLSDCTQCHSSANSPALDPLVTNGSGTYGKHVKHFQERRITCERCHDNYLGAATHLNGTFDKGNPAVVNMNIVGPAGTWDTATGRCSGVACHDNTTLDWYGTSTWTTPSVCGECHSSAYSPALDPTATSGTPPAGRHVKHVASRGIACERCHVQYPSRTTHANGVLDTPDPAVNIMQFNIVGSTGAWTGDTGAQTGQCADISCHGTDTLAWYGTGTWTLSAVCTTCHSSSYSSQLDPLVTNGSGLAGKHGKHVASYGMACSKCHLDYPARATHADGSLDTPEPAVPILSFDATNPTGTWINDTGPETGSCSSLFCHGTESPDWYTLSGVTQPVNCGICHGNPIGSRRQVLGAGGDFATNPTVSSHHITGLNDPTSDQCLVCHDMSFHTAGSVHLKNADTGASLLYSSTTPSTTEPFCLSCHDNTGALFTFIAGGTPTSPFNDGSVLGQTSYRASMDIADSWSKTYGHRQKGLTCLGSGAPDTGCHANGHGAAAVGILAKNLQIPQPDRYREPDFAICLDCHQSYANVSKEAIFGVKFTEVVSGATITHNYDWGYGPPQNPLLRSDPADVYKPPYNLSGGIQTHFRDQNYRRATGKIYDDMEFYYDPEDSEEFLNLHWLHIGSQAWNYRGMTPQTGISCTACHSVHGTNTQNGMVHDEMQYRVFSAGSDSYGTMLGDLNRLDQYPTYCAFNCHGMFYDFFGGTSNWYEPSNE